MHTNTYFPVSPEPQITPESYLASSRLDAVMIYSGGDFLMSEQSAAALTLSGRFTPGS